MENRLRYCSKSSDRFLNIIKRCFGNNPCRRIRQFPTFYTKLLSDILWFFLKPPKVETRAFVYIGLISLFKCRSKYSGSHSFLETRKRTAMTRCNLKLLIRMFSAKNESLCENFWKIEIVIKVYCLLRMSKLLISILLKMINFELIRTRLQVLLHWSIRGLTDYEFYNPSSVYTNQEA